MPTYVLIAINVAVYIYTSFLSGDALVTDQVITARFGQYNDLVLRGEFWRLFTAMFIHANVVHIFGNMFFLLIFGLRAEDLFDLKEYLFVYFMSGLSGGLLSLMLGPNVISVGASGAIFGVLGACTIYFRRAFGQSILSALIYSFFIFAINVGPNVNLLAHLGGLVVGLLIGYILATSRKPKSATSYTYTYSYSV